MEFTGQLIGVSKDWNSDKFQITFSVNEKIAFISEYDKIKEVSKFAIRVIKHREKRSLDANAYAWVLMSKIAYKIKSSK